MEDLSLKLRPNVPGPYYVNRECIGCTLCTEIAPENFKIHNEEDAEIMQSYIFKQPDSESEKASCVEAMENCPAGSICDDGKGN